MVDAFIQFTLGRPQAAQLAGLVGPADSHLQWIEDQLQVRIVYQGAHFHVRGDHPYIQQAADLLSDLYQWQQHTQQPIDTALIQLKLREIQDQSADHSTPFELVLKDRTIRPRGTNQQRYLHRIFHHVLNFGIGPAGTGKTYLAVAAAVHALLTNQVKRVILVRPVVEAGEHLGFLPGTVAEKIDPYLRPLFDALHDMMGPEAVQQAFQKNMIEIAPLAYMRGRTLHDAFIILDESQNTTVSQMKMFLTRIGFHSTVVITGDTSQIDLPAGKPSGLQHAVSILSAISAISFTWFSSQDIVRHPLVQTIVDAYAQAEETKRGKPAPVDPPQANTQSNLQEDPGHVPKTAAHSQDPG